MRGGDDATTREAQVQRRAPVILKVIERAMLILVAGLTVVAAGFELRAIVVNQAVSLADILLMFLYTEVIGMVAVF